MIKLQKGLLSSQLTAPDLPTLSGFRVVLRPPQASDYNQWHEVRQRNADYLRPWEPTWPENCLEQDFFKRRLRRQMQDWQYGRAYSFLIFDAKDDTLIGGVNINNVLRGVSQQAWLGYWIDQDMQGQGLMAEALRLVMRHSFEQLDLHRLNAACLPANERSAKLLLKLGFTEEGLARKYIRINGTWHDHRLFGYCAEDWQG